MFGYIESGLGIGVCVVVVGTVWVSTKVRSSCVIKTAIVLDRSE